MPILGADTARSYRYQQPPPLPPADSIPFPGNLVRQCSGCGLIKGCTAPVPGVGSIPSRVMLVGEAPGFNEDQWGKPFVGAAGRYLDSLLFQVGIPRESVYVTNCVRCKPPANRTPKPTEVCSCSKWLDVELSLVHPEIVVAMGGTAIRRLMGDNAGTVEHLHGKPVQVDGRIVLPAYHPAAALHNPTLLRQCQEDFRVLGGLVKGVDWREYHVEDEYPDPDYRVADTDAKLKQMQDEVRDAGEFAVDTEICHGELWSVQISAVPGTAWFIPIKSGYKGRVDLRPYNATVIVHNYLFDVNYLVIPDGRFTDSMELAYLLGQPQGLKELASRLCGINMKTYREVVHPGQQGLALDYLRRVSKQEWPDPPTIEETKWDNKKGCLVTRNKKPWHISRKINKALDDYTKDDSTDLWDRWRNIPDEERVTVEGVMGAMPESSLADIPMEQAVQYACLDSNATIRVYHKLKKMAEELDLNCVLKMDLDILPMVHSMMQNGMAVDLDHFRNLSRDYDIRMRVKAAELAGMVGHPFNPNSSPQVAAVIYNELGFKPTKSTPGGEVSTDDAELKKTGHPVAKGIIQYRNIQKLKGTYADALVEWAVPDERGVPRVYTTLKTTRVETGRLASALPNLQNVPTRNKEAKAIKNGFIAPNGKLLAEGDLGQIEIRTQTHLAMCKGLIELFLSGKDPHTTTASRLFGVSYDDAKQDKYRYPCKRAGFGIIYMIGARGLSTQINEYIADLQMAGEPVDVEPWDEPTCQKFIDDYYKLYPEIRDYQMEQVAMARRFGYVRDLFGRIRYIPEMGCPIRSVQEAGARMAVNMPVTASATGVIKAAMGEIWRRLPGTEWAGMVKCLMQIHDSLLFEVDEQEDVYLPFLRWVRSIMCNSVSLVVPITADFKIGKRWGELKRVKLEEMRW